MNPDSTIRYRSATISRKGIDNDSRTAELSFASNEPAERSFGIEVLDCSPAAVDLSRLNAGGNLLLDHDHRDVVGVVEQAVANGDKCRARVRFGKSARASEIWSDVQEGIRTTVSVGYSIQEMKEEPKRDGNTKPVFRVTRWTPLEISLTSIPLDATVGVGRSTNHYPHNTMTPPTTTDRGPQSQHDDQATKIRANAEHWSKLHLALKFDPLVEAERCIANDMSATDFQKHCADSIEEPMPIRVMPSEGSPSGYNHRGASGGSSRSLGALLGDNQDFKKFIRQSGRKYVSVDFPEIANVRAALTMSGTGISAIDHKQMIVPVPEQRLTVADLFSQGITNGNTVRYIRESAWTNTAATVAEGAAKPELADLDLSDIDAPVRKLAAWTRISNEMLDDAPAVASYLNSRLQYAVEFREEAQLLNGDGTGTNLTGILNVAGIQTQAKGADTVPDAIRKGITKIQLAQMTPTGLILHPNDFEAISLLKDTQGRYLIGDVFSMNEMGVAVRTPSIWGLPIVVTTSATENTGIIGAFKQSAWLWRRSGVTISASNQDADNFTKNMVTVLCEERLAAGLVLPAGICTVTGI